MPPLPTVLIIEDDPVFRRVLSFTVAKGGMAALTANDGDEGFDLLMKGEIDFIVTDLQMPGCGGVELLQRLDSVSGYERPPAILCTAKGLELDSDQLKREFRLTAIMHKPFSPRKLTELLLNSLSHESLMRSTSPSPTVQRSPKPSVSIDKPWIGPDPVALLSKSLHQTGASHG